MKYRILEHSTFTCVSLSASIAVKELGVGETEAYNDDKYSAVVSINLESSGEELDSMVLSADTRDKISELSEAWLNARLASIGKMLKTYFLAKRCDSSACECSSSRIDDRSSCFWEGDYDCSEEPSEPMSEEEIDKLFNEMFPEKVQGTDGDHA